VGAFSGFILPDTPAPVFWSFVAAAILVQGISKSGFAGGAGILSLPLMMLVMPVDKVAAAMLPLLILCDFNAIYHHRDNKDWAAIRAIYLPAVLGILAGAALWWWIGREGVEAHSAPLKRGVGVIAILFGVYVLARERSLAWAARHRGGRAAALLAGSAAGFTSTLAHAAGPIVSLYVYSLDLGKSRFVGTVAWTFTLINLTKLPFYGAVGLIDAGVLRFDLVLVPLIPLGSWLGHWMHHRVSEARFNRIIVVLTLVAGVQLLFNVPVIQIVLAWLLGR
jgi:uncharacterized membrane protein YfcA